MAKVLVVDDEADLRVLLTTMLRMAGHEVVEAEGGEAALAAMAAMNVDVVLLDLMMPAMDGWAVLWDLHDRPTHPPVIVMSARPEYSKDRPPLGAVRYLQKPFPMQVAVDSIEAVLAASA
jgi:DNA-binding response OmpR family regulator